MGHISISASVVLEKNEKSSTDSSDIASFFENSTVFVTGVTGFLGHVLLVKLLW